MTRSLIAFFLLALVSACTKKAIQPEVTSFKEPIVPTFCKDLPVKPASALGQPLTMENGATLELVHQSSDYFEGPTFNPSDGYLYFSAFGATTRVLRLKPRLNTDTALDDSNGINGTYLSKSGRLLAAQGYSKKIMSYAFSPSGLTDGKALMTDNDLVGPNDLVEMPSGDIYFTDPDFGAQSKSGVYLLDVQGNHRKVVSDMRLPNGIIRSLDGTRLYVGDSQEKLWKVLSLDAAGGVLNSRTFFNPDVSNQADPDGMTIDEEGTLYFTGRGGLWAVCGDGTPMGFVPTTEFCSNLTFGDTDGKSLYVTCDKSVYRLRMKVRGGLITTTAINPK